MNKQEDSRLDVVEVDLRALRDSVQNLDIEMGSLKTALNSVVLAVDRLATQLSDTVSKPTPWGYILSGIGTLTIVMALVFAPIYNRIDRREDVIDNRIERIEAQQRLQHQSDIAQAYAHGKLETELDSLKEFKKLQQEILIDRAMAQ